MKRIILLLSVFIAITGYSQKIGNFDIIKGNDEIYIRDTTLKTFVETHTSGSSTTAANGIKKTGSLFELGAPLNQTTTINGVSYPLYLGTAASKLGAFQVNASTINLNSDGNFVLKGNSVTTSFISGVIINSLGDTTSSKSYVREQVEDFVRYNPIMWNYSYKSTEITDTRPTPGYFKVNNADATLATELYIDDYDNSVINRSNFIQLADTGSYFIIEQIDDNERYVTYQITGGYVDASGYTKYKVGLINSGDDLEASEAMNCYLVVNNTTGGGSAGTSTPDSVYQTLEGTVSITTPKLIGGNAYHDTLFFNSGGYIASIDTGKISILDLNVTGTLASDKFLCADSTWKVPSTPIDNILDWNGTAYAPYASYQANSFYSGTTTPTGTTRLNYDGYLYTTQINTNNLTSATTNGYAISGQSTTSGTGIYGISASGNAADFRQTGNVAVSSALLILQRPISGSGDVSGNLISITDNPATSGTISGKILSATIGSTERISLNPRSTTTGTAYFFDTHSLLTTGTLFDVRNNGTSVFKIKSDSVSAPNLTAKFGSVISEKSTSDTVAYPDGSYSVGAIDIGDVELSKLNTDTLIIGTDTITSEPKELYLSIYDGSVTLTATQNVYAKITGLTERYNQDDYFTVAGDSIQLTAGYYSIDYDISFVGTSTDIFRGAIFDDNAAITTGGGWKRGMSGTDSGVVRSKWVGNIPSSSWISFRMMNSANNNDPTITDVNISIRKIK